MVRVPPELLWDYPVAPEDPLWRLQRVGEFFPQFGRDRETVRALWRHRSELRLPPEVVALIGLYAETHGVLDAA
jgi:hypothetical protein